MILRTQTVEWRVTTWNQDGFSSYATFYDVESARAYARKWVEAEGGGTAKAEVLEVETTVIRRPVEF